MPRCSRCGHANPEDARFCGECAFPVEDVPGPPPDGTLGGGRYRIDAVIGEGDMGRVYRATDVSLQRTVAIKVLHPELVALPAARLRMLQEARVLACVEHPNVVPVRTAFEEGGAPAMELEFMPGGNLLNAIPDGGMTEQEAIRVIVCVLGGLQAMHDAGLVHRDVKPENVLLAADHTPKLNGLGLARDPSAQAISRAGTVPRPPEYMAPEQILCQPVDRRADLYAAGVMLCRMLTGKMPFSAVSDFEWRIAHVQHPPGLEAVRAKASAAVVAVIDKALAKAPEARWRTADEMVNALTGPMRSTIDHAASAAEIQTLLTQLQVARAEVDHARAEAAAARMAAPRPRRSETPGASGPAPTPPPQAESMSRSGQLVVAMAVVASGFVIFQMAYSPEAPGPRPAVHKRTPQSAPTAPVSRPAARATRSKPDATRPPPSAAAEAVLSVGNEVISPQRPVDPPNLGQANVVTPDFTASHKMTPTATRI